jgi:hypothetical protein
VGLSATAFAKHQDEILAGQSCYLVTQEPFASSFEDQVGITA